MLVGCRRLFALQDEVSDQDLRTIAAQLGSDVPFLIQGGSAIVEGFGDQIVPQEGLPDSHLVLVFTGAACPTGGIYARFDAGPEARLQPDKVRSAAAGSVPPFNDLAAPAMAHAPELAEAASKLEQLIECDVHVSGSGATLFMLCNGEVEAHAVAEAVTTKLNLPAIAVAPALRQILSETPTT